MATDATEAAAGAEAARRWSASTNWIVTDGSLDGSISFDTTEDDGPAAAPGGVLLLQPPADESLPCEITVSFTGKHNIHRIYIRSTARIYEIYFASDQHNNSMEYLCTVRCGVAGKEETPPSEQATTKSQDSNGARQAHEQIVQGDNSSSDEDGWVQVKLPDSRMRDDHAKVLSNKVMESTNQVHYEATAEISDASPCPSITFRLLSLQPKACVHIEEIYIYADPVESVETDTSASMGGNVGGSSLLAMLVPGLLQFSRPDTSRTDDRQLSNDLTVQSDKHDASKTAEMGNLDTGSMTPREEYATIADQRLEQEQEQEPGTLLENAHLGSRQKVTTPSKLADSVDENNVGFSRVEKVLDELVSRVGRVEAFCSRFEENMMKPIGRIETRLQRLEQQLDVFAARPQPSEQCPRFKFSAPEFQSSGSDSENNDCNLPHIEGDRSHQAAEDLASSIDTTTTSFSGPQMCPGLIIKAPDFSNEDDDFSHSGEDCPNGSKSVPLYSESASVLETRICSGLAVKAPEFLNEDDGNTNFGDTSEPSLKECRSRNRVSVDGALASALKAFMTSISVKPPNPSPIEVPDESSIVTNSDLSSSSVRVVSKVSEDLYAKSGIGDNSCVTTEAAGKKTDMAEPLSPVNKAIAPDNSHNEFCMEDRVCEAAGAVREGAALDDLSLLTDNLAPSTCSSERFSGLITKAPDFPIEQGSLVHHFDCSDSDEGAFLEGQVESLHDEDLSSTFEVFLSSNMYIERTSDVIKAAIENQKENVMPRSEIMEKISNFLKLSSNQELPMEVVTLDKLKSRIARSENHAELEHLDCMIALVTYIRDCHVKAKQLHSINGVPIPADFCCPLSQELMSDPVIVASGQTYERAFIRKWLDEGFNVCPKTWQTLVHTSLIPNYTVKALIANWCESNDIKLPDSIKSVSLNPPSAFVSTNDSSACDIKNISKPSNCSTSLVDSSFVVSDTYNELNFSSSGVPCEGAEGNGKGKHGDGISGMISLDLLLNSAPDSSEQKECNKLGQKSSLQDELVEESAFHYKPLEDGDFLGSVDASDSDMKACLENQTASLADDMKLLKLYDCSSSSSLGVAFVRVGSTDTTDGGKDRDRDRDTTDGTLSLDLHLNSGQGILEQNECDKIGQGSTVDALVEESTYPYIPLENSNFVGYFSTSGSNTTTYLENHAANLGDNTKSPISTLYYSTVVDGSLEDSDTYKNDLPSLFGVLCEGASCTDMEKYGEDNNGIVNLNLLLNSGQGTLEQNECFMTRQNVTSLDPLLEESSFQYRPLEDGTCNEDNGMQWNGWGSDVKVPKEEKFVQNFNGSTFGLNGSIIDHFRDGNCTEVGDYDEPRQEGPTWNQLGRGCDKNNGDISSSQDIFVNQVQTELDRSVEDYWSRCCSANHSSINTEITRIHSDISEGMPQLSLGCSYDKSEGRDEVQVLWKEEYTPVGNDRDEVAYELLPGEKPLTSTIVDIDADTDIDDSTVTGVQNQLLPTLVVDQNTAAVDLHLLEVGILQSPGSSSHEQLTSLI